MSFFTVDLQNPNASAVLLALTAVVAVPVTYFVRRSVWSRAMHKYTGVLDAARAGQPRQGGRVSGTAVVCGGSIAGLLAARVLWDHFERVVVVEPEGWTFTDAAQAPPEDDVGKVVKEGVAYNTVRHKRTRVYQYSAIHGFQSLLTDIMVALFPASFGAAIKTFGIFVGPTDPNTLNAGWTWPIPWARYPSGVTPATILATRRTLEPFIRFLVRSACPTIEFVHGIVTDLVLDEKGGRVSAVVVRESGDGGSTRSLPCALVADCTGVAQAGLKMLTRALPKGAVPDDLREHYGPQMQYATLEFPRVGLDAMLRAVAPMRSDGRSVVPPEHVGIVFTYFPDPAGEYRSLSILRTERDGVMILAGGWASEMPVTYEDLRAYVDKTLHRNKIPRHVIDLLDALEPHADEAVVTESRVTSCSWIHYHRATALPPNFVALGDSSMRMNPRFAEGTTKAALGAITLDGVLRDLAPGSRTFGRTFFSRLALRTQSMWESAKYADYAHESTTPVPGETLSDGAFVRWYNKKLQPVLSRNETAAKALWDVSNFVAPSSVLFAPSILLSILREVLFPSRQA